MLDKQFVGVWRIALFQTRVFTFRVSVNLKRSKTLLKFTEIRKVTTKPSVLFSRCNRTEAIVQLVVLPGSVGLVDSPDSLSSVNNAGTKNDASGRLLRPAGISCFDAAPLLLLHFSSCSQLRPSFCSDWLNGPCEPPSDFSHSAVAVDFTSEVHVGRQMIVFE